LILAESTLAQTWTVWFFLGMFGIVASFLTRRRYGPNFHPRLARWELRIGIVLLAIGLLWLAVALILIGTRTFTDYAQ
jgi:hypothetical protein